VNLTVRWTHAACGLNGVSGGAVPVTMQYVVLQVHKWNNNLPGTITIIRNGGTVSQHMWDCVLYCQSDSV
jgi:hypothetical protein